MTARLLATVVAAAGLALLPTPAGAIETETFGIAADERAAGDPHRRVRVEVEPGGEASLHLRVWNKTNAPLALSLDALPATIGDDGTPVLGGDASAVSWVSLDAPALTLGPKRQRIVTLTVDAPGGASGSHPVAVVASPVTADPAPAVVERVGVVVELVATGTAASGPGAADSGLPVLPVLAALSLLGAVAAGAWRHRERVGDLGLGPQPPPPFAYAAHDRTRSVEEHAHGAHRRDGVRNAAGSREARRAFVPRRPLRPTTRRAAPPRTAPTSRGLDR